uniref:Uncharacterized protein n=1 Tax=Setaria viridis TaxID=4556 RepID=A0A4U6T174_SETVI|nr:hypothetical protein SEVIR_9G347300v2 [Setaria viridis]
MMDPPPVLPLLGAEGPLQRGDPTGRAGAALHVGCVPKGNNLTVRDPPLHGNDGGGRARALAVAVARWWRRRRKSRGPGCGLVAMAVKEEQGPTRGPMVAVAEEEQGPARGPMVAAAKEEQGSASGRKWEGGCNPKVAARKGPQPKISIDVDDRRPAARVPVHRHRVRRARPATCRESATRSIGAIHWRRFCTTVSQPEPPAYVVRFVVATRCPCAATDRVHGTATASLLSAGGGDGDDDGPENGRTGRKTRGTFVERRRGVVAFGAQVHVLGI